MMLPARRGLKVLNVAAQPVLRTIGKVVGADVLADAIAFFQAFEGMETGFRERADEVIALLTSTDTRYVLVASPRADTVDEARWFAGRLRETALAPAALVVNRATPSFPTARGRRRAADHELWQNADELNAMASAERQQLTALLADVGDAAVAWVPLLPSDVHDLDSLDEIRRRIFGSDDVMSGRAAPPA